MKHLRYSYTLFIFLFLYVSCSKEKKKQDQLIAIEGFVKHNLFRALQYESMKVKIDSSFKNVTISSDGHYHFVIKRKLGKSLEKIPVIINLKILDEGFTVKDTITINYQDAKNSIVVKNIIRNDSVGIPGKMLVKVQGEDNTNVKKFNETKLLSTIKGQLSIYDTDSLKKTFIANIPKITQPSQQELNNWLFRIKRDKKYDTYETKKWFKPNARVIIYGKRGTYQDNRPLDDFLRLLRGGVQFQEQFVAKWINGSKLNITLVD